MTAETTPGARGKAHGLSLTRSRHSTKYKESHPRLLLLPILGSALGCRPLVCCQLPLLTVLPVHSSVPRVFPGLTAVPSHFCCNRCKTIFMLDPTADEYQVLTVTLVQSMKKGTEEIGIGFLDINSDVMM